MGWQKIEQDSWTVTLESEFAFEELPDVSECVCVCM